MVNGLVQRNIQCHWNFVSGCTTYGDFEATFNCRFCGYNPFVVKGEEPDFQYSDDMQDARLYQGGKM